MRFKGRTWKFGKDIDTDLIIPSRYLQSSDPKELGRHCLEIIRPNFPNSVKRGDFIVALKNFGCGSSREHAVLAIKGLGISAVIAKSFARIFYRNCINLGLPPLECPEAVDEIVEGDLLEVDLEEGRIYNETRGESFKTIPFPPFIQEIIGCGGLLNYYAKRI